MATLLEDYISMRTKVDEHIDKLPLEKVIKLQEMNYRISVLKTASQFCKTSPVGTNVNALGFHYQVVDVFINQLVKERKFGPKADENGLKQREMASISLQRVVNDHKERFKKFMPENDMSYKENIRALFAAILPVWIQYRNTYVNISV